ncbi:putative xanthine dehydrogenase subunit A [Pigmentiphaga humi]|uniref:Putative xanthine dehydrogenase subunit A n=2 Tax=Pigmentiphaga humi TaxID=2478468 RepID=A0A3P4B1E7_9BURK|nr:putative xanthine dehydrogenase subunit A [Pigmentiphaga humi]
MQAECLTIMDNVDLDVLRRLAQWRREGHRAVLGTVTRTWGSAPRPVGAMVAVREDGAIAGSVSGGCIEDDLADKARSGAWPADVPSVVRYGISGEEATRFGLPCGGTLELVLEPVAGHSGLDELLAKLEDGRRVLRRLDLASGRATLEPARDAADTVALGDGELVATHGPSWRLLIIGAGQMSQYLAQMAQALDYEVIVCDPREEYSEGWNVPGTRLVATMPDDTVTELRPDRHTAVVALTHDPKLDDLALMEALKSEAFYVGAIGSRANQRKRRERLLDFDLTADDLARLHGPVGLRIGARTPSEIAVAILAHMTAERYGYHKLEFEPSPYRAARGPL